MPFCHYGHENEFIKDNVGMLDEVLDGKRKQTKKIFIQHDPTMLDERLDSFSRP